MSVSTYKNNDCKYRLDKLAKVVYLISEEASKNIHIDDGEAYITDIDEEPLSLSVYNIALSDTDTLDERYRFTHQLTFSVNGYANYKDFQGKYFAIVKTIDEEYWLINPMFPCKVTFTYTLGANESHTDFTLSTISNHPTLRVHGLNHSIPYECGYRLCGIESLKLNESIYSLKRDNHVLYTNDGFKDVVFDKNSGVFTEQFDGNYVSHDIKFDIKFDDYKSSWHYNLLEFTENTYAAVIKTTCNKYVLCGFGFGLNPSFQIEASDETTPDKIHIDLIDMHDNGDFVGYEEDVTIEKDDTSKWVYTNKYNGYECVGNNLARYLLMEEVDALMNPTGNYKCLIGYEDQFSFLNIVGTFTETETFNSYDCADNCRIQTSFPLEFVFNNVSCREYSLVADSDWSITSSASHITVTPSNGSAGESYTVSVCNTQAPSSTDLTSTLTVNYCNRSKTYTVRVKQGDSCLPAGSVFDISANGQYVTIPTSCCVREAKDFTNQITNISIQNSYIRVYVPQNNSGNPRQFIISITYCDGREGEALINQGTGFERWVKESTACTSNQKCDVERKYTGTTLSNINTRTEETRLTNCVTSSECGGRSTRWIDSTETTCSGGKKYIVQIEQVSTDGGQSWSNTGEKRLGSETADPSGECAGVEEFEDWRENGYVCVETTKYNRLQLYVSTDGTNWIATNTYKRGDRILETNSTDCGYIIPSTGWTYEDWRLVETDYICDDGNKYEKLRRWVSSDNVNWIPTDVYKRGDLIEANSGDCGYDPTITGNCSEYRYDGDTICDGYNKYQYLRKYVRECEDCNQCSNEWQATQIYKRGDLIQTNSFDCGYIPSENYFEWRTSGTICDGFNKYYRERKYISEDGNRWYETNIYRQGSLIEANSADCGYVPPIVYDYRWTITTQTTCVSYNKYYLYKQQRKISGSSTWEDVIPTVFSYNGNGTMEPQLIEADSADCGYVPPTPDPQYKWVLLDSSQYMCDECDVASFRWVTVNTYCNDIDKYAHQKLQYSLDGGATWSDVEPQETQEVLVEYNSRECGSSDYKVVSFGKFNSPYTSYCAGSNIYTITENDVLGNEVQKANVTGATIGTCGTAIATNAFYGTSITALTIPSNITEIGNNAFGYSDMTEITFESSTPPTIGTLIFSHSNITKIYVPSESVDAYKTASGWSDYADKIQPIQ